MNIISLNSQIVDQKTDIDKDTKESSVQIAKELLKIGMEVKQIIEITHLTREEIEKIIEEN